MSDHVEFRAMALERGQNGLLLGRGKVEVGTQVFSNVFDDLPSGRQARGRREAQGSPAARLCR